MILTVTLNSSIDKLYMLEALHPYQVMRVKEVSNTAGGKGMNVARVAAQLGEKVIAAGFVGGFNGQYFESLITETNIEKAFTHVAAETRSCINGWDEKRGLSTEYLEPGAPVTAGEAGRFDEDFASQLPRAEVVVLSGSIPPGMPEDCYTRLVERCREAGKPVLVDTSGESLRRVVGAKPDFMKPNTDEVAQLIGHRPETMEEISRCAQELQRGGIATVVVSLGGDGALMACKDGVYRGIPPAITPKNTVGCGDSMVAGFAVGIQRKLPPKEQLQLALAVATANALSLRTGAYEEQDFRRLLPVVKVEKLMEQGV